MHVQEVRRYVCMEYVQLLVYVQHHGWGVDTWYGYLWMHVQTSRWMDPGDGYRGGGIPPLDAYRGVVATSYGWRYLSTTYMYIEGVGMPLSLYMGCGSTRAPSIGVDTTSIMRCGTPLAIYWGGIGGPVSR